jgi:hypothetical protein
MQLHQTALKSEIWNFIAKSQNAGVLTPKCSHFGINQNNDILVPNCSHFDSKIRANTASILTLK